MFKPTCFLWLFCGLLFISSCVLADTDYIVDHLDPVEIDPQLSLTQLIDYTLEKYPDGALIPALQAEIKALQQRGNSWLAGALTASFFYRDDALGNDTGNREIVGAIQAPLWNWGQRQAGQNLAQQAEVANNLKISVLKWQVAGLVRSALWNIKLQKHRYQLASNVYDVSKQLANTIKRRVELGDLARADYLLARSESLQKRSELITAEAEVMHARKHFTTLTQMNRIPEQFQETQSPLTDLSIHPALNAINASINRKKAHLHWIRARGSGQSRIALGGQSERSSRSERDVENMTFSLSIPFGGSAHLAPEIAASNLELSQAISQRDQLLRSLDEDFHEAQHNLEVDHAELAIANELKAIAQDHLKMAQLSFEAGEINLMDFLRIQERTQKAIQHASEKFIMLQRDIALYNQAVGVLP